MSTATATVSEPEEVAVDSPAEIAPAIALAAVGTVVAATTSVLNTALQAVNTGINIAQLTNSTSNNRQVQIFEIRNHSRPRPAKDDVPYNPGAVLYLSSFSTSSCAMLETFVLLRPGESDTLSVTANYNAAASVTLSGTVVDVQDGKEVKDSFALTITYDNNNTGWCLKGGNIWQTGHVSLKNTKVNLYFLGSESQGGTSCLEIIPEVLTD